MRVIRKKAIQVHPVPDRIIEPSGPFPDELFEEPEIVDNYRPHQPEDGSDFPLGATAQNDYKPPKHVRCAYCLKRVLETDTDEHVCE